jgi:hypothetical protein
MSVHKINVLRNHSKFTIGTALKAVNMINLMPPKWTTIDQKMVKADCLLDKLSHVRFHHLLPKKKLETDTHFSKIPEPSVAKFCLYLGRWGTLRYLRSMSLVSINIYLRILISRAMPYSIRHMQKHHRFLLACNLWDLNAISPQHPLHNAQIKPSPKTLFVTPTV